MKQRTESGRSPHPLLLRIGKTVRTLRLARGWTQKKLAVSSGLSQRFVCDIEAGLGNASILKLAQLSETFALPISALLAESDGKPTARVIALLGIRGAGKSTIGARLARSLNLPLVELDPLVEDAGGLSTGEIFDMHGEAYYRRLELEALRGVLSSDLPAVLATNGGIVTSPEALGLLRASCLLVWLKAPVEEYLRRVRGQGDERPMKNRPNALRDLRALLRAREAFYSSAHHIVDTHRLGIEGSVSFLLDQLGAGEGRD